jgi:hypothetical protein
MSELLAGNSLLELRHEANGRRRLGAALAALMAWSAFGQAQSQITRQQDPLMSLMLSQPPLDTTSPVRAQAGFDPPVVRPGTPSCYRVSFNALEQTIAWPQKLVAPAGLTLRPAAHGQILQMTGSNMAPLTVFNNRTHPAQVGEFVIPEFTVTVEGKPVTVPEAKLEVMESPPGTAPPFQQIFLELRATNLYAGQPVSARVLYPGAPGTFPQMTQVQLTGEGFLVDQSTARPRFEPTVRGGITVMNSVYEITLVPIASGKLSLFAQGFAISNRSFGPGTINPGAMPVSYTLLDSEPIIVDVGPLPREGQLPGFTGAIGNFTLEPPRLSATALRVGEPVKLSVRVRGGTGVTRLVAPPPPKVEEWEVFSASDAAPLPQALPAQGVAVFSYTLVPLSTKARATPLIPFCFFDPKKGGYSDLPIPPLPITVSAGYAPADVQALRQSESIEGKDAEPGLSDPATVPGRTAASLTPVQLQSWFPAAQLVPAVGFFGLWYWDRRRRFLEQHPELVRCRQARRALRRQRRALRRAVQAGDAERFAATAVGALRIACAPHFPAEPRALVGADVLQVLGAAAGPEGQGRAADLVRRFFTITDATRFSTTAADAAGLLALLPDLEQVLQGLENKLCV